MWDLFRVSSDKLALCHLELTRKLSDLIREINKYGDEQVKVHRKNLGIGSHILLTLRPITSCSLITGIMPFLSNWLFFLLGNVGLLWQHYITGEL
ncbi:F-BAR domain only protein 1 [Acipenser ruthenus]|uniref:F-BAR domain only protein 1 n=1 Tax=Acipenser ruthenus TaxID=7906 RepID=A0A662Z0Q5_ACIRT|nr:F-BAR domain only protein 1 [Acipenser ruthenus]